MLPFAFAEQLQKGQKDEKVYLYATAATAATGM